MSNKIDPEKLESILKQIKRKTAIINSLGDIQEGLAVDIESLLKSIDGYTMYSKKTIKSVRQNAELFRNEINRRYKNSPDMKINFGEITDMLKEFIYSIIKTKEDNNDDNK